MQWETVIGLEVHVQLATQSKIFTGAPTTYGAKPNTQACDVSIALPGTLPVMNYHAAKLAVKFGLGINAQINRRSVFVRKNYFYPDLPKGYQISQFELPVVGKGELEIETPRGKKIIGITRAHLEEDAGKSLHENTHGKTGIDLNRAGTPLLEIVSEPDMRSAEEAISCLKKLHVLVRYLGVSNGNMQEGSFRCDANVSIRPKGQETFGTRAELKNINSFRFVEKAINHEVERQIDILEQGGEIIQETRLYDSDKDETRSMRSKEEAHDYRYFPDPDLPTLEISEKFIQSIKDNLPELPEDRKNRFINELGLNEQAANKITLDIDVANYFETTAKATQIHAKTVANWVSGELTAALNQAELEITDCPVSPQSLAQLLDRVHDGTLSGKLAREVFALLWREPEKRVDILIKEKGFKQITDNSAIEAVVDEVLGESESQIKQFHDGNRKIIGYLVGQVMKKSSGKANPQQVNQLLIEKLG